MYANFGRCWAFLVAETKTWGGIASWFTTFFILATLVTNFVQGIFSLDLLPIFENTFFHMRTFFNACGDFLIVRPLVFSINFLIDLLKFDYHITYVHIPRAFTDLMAISMILSRAERASMKMAPPLKHDTEIAYSKTERIAWFFILFFYIPTKAILWPVRRFGHPRIYQSLRIFLDGLTLLGILFLIHDILSVRANWYDTGSDAASHRAFVAFLLLSLFSAVVACLVFLALNGAVQDYF